MRLLPTVLLLMGLSGFSARGAVWYVDAAATGANNGGPGNDAFTDLLSVDKYYNRVQPGDTVSIKGGSYGTLNPADPAESATTAVWRMAGGTSGNWVRYIMTNGPVRTWRSLNVPPYCSVYAGATPGYEQCISNNTFNILFVTNNCNLHLIRETNFYDCGSYGRSINISGEPIVIQWVEMTGSTNIGVSAGVDESASSQEVYYYGDTLSLSNEFSYCWINRSSGHGAGAAIAVNGNADAFDRFNIRYCLFETNGSDVINLQSGVNVDHFIIRNRDYKGVSQNCNDSFTVSGTGLYNRIHHGIMEAADNSIYYLWGVGKNGDGHNHDFGYYCIMLVPVRPDYWANPIQGGGSMQQQTDLGLDYNLDSNLLFAQITWVGTTNGGPGNLMSFISKDGLSRNVVVNAGALAVKNNLFVAVDQNPTEVLCPLGFGVSSGHPGGVNNRGYGWSYDASGIPLDYNLFGAYRPGNLAACNWGQSGATVTYLTNASDVQGVTGYTHNQTVDSFRFVDADHYDYRPASASAVMGENLTSLKTQWPDIDIDIMGNQRPAVGAWTVGAIEYVDQKKYLDITFDEADWATNGASAQITDHSGYGNHLQAFDFTGWNLSTWPQKVAGPGTLSAARFGYAFTNSGGFGVGQYLGMTNWNGSLDSFTNLTLSVWVYVDPAYTNDNGFGAILDVGYDTGRWRFGEYYSQYGPSFDVITNSDGANSFLQTIKFPSYNVTMTNWNHYCVTWDGTTIIGYLNGAQYATYAYSGAYLTDATLVSTNSNPDRRKSWIAVGCSTHNGTPDIMDVDALPNNGFLGDTKLAGIRIYGRALSAAEVASLASVQLQQVATPTFSPTGPVVASFPQTVTLSCDTAGATIYYTTDGSTPTTGSSSGTSASLTTDPQTLKAIAVKSGMSDSAVASQTYSTATAPSITAQPQSQTASVGQDINFEVAASGSLPLSYQWRKGGSDLPTQTQATCFLSHVTSSDAGSYDVVVTNPYGTATSSAATLGFTQPSTFGSGVSFGAGVTIKQ